MDDIDRIVFDHFPVEELPPRVREGLNLGSQVRLIVEREQEALPTTFAEIFAATADLRRPGVDAVARVREIRDEWDHRDQLHERIRAGNGG